MKLYEQFFERVEKFLPDSYFQKENNLENIDSLLENPQFKELFAHSPAVVGVFNIAKMGYDFLSNNVKEIFGYEKDLFTIPGGMEKVLATFKPEHALAYNQFIFPVIFEYFKKSTSQNNIKRYRFTSPFQLKRSDGELIWCMQQIRVISTDRNNYPILSLLFISDITNIKKDDDIDFVIACKDDQDVFENVYIFTIPSSGNAVGFSKREIEILSYIKQGLSSKEIAQALLISDHTVHNHRKNIIKKSNGKNIMEIIQMMSSKKIL